MKVKCYKTDQPLLSRVHIILCKCDKTYNLFVMVLIHIQNLNLTVSMVRFKTLIDTVLITNALKVFKMFSINVAIEIV